LQGLTVEDALAILSRTSENEEYGVNDNREFFFRRREESAGEKDIVDANVVNWDIPERAKETKNEITVWYNNGDDRITVSLGNEQIEVQDSLDTESPVPFPDEINRPEITERQEALATGRQFLREREATLTGEVTVVGDFDYLNNEIGDTINVTVTPRGIDDEFVIVSKDVSYLRDTVSFGIVEKRGDQDSLLREIGKQLKREELSATDRQQKSDIVTQTTIRADLQQSYSGVSTEIDRVTTTCRNKLRDGWLGDKTLEINEAILGQADSISRALTSIPNEQERISVTPAKSGDTAVTVDFDFNADGNVIGFEDTNGDLLFVSRFEETIDAPEGTFTLNIADNSDKNSVLTETGQEAIRDLFVGETTLAATQAAYGTNGAQPTESDSGITNAVSTDYAESLVASASTSGDWIDNLDIPENVPLSINAAENRLELEQVCFHLDARNDAIDDNRGIANDSKYTDGQAAFYSAPDHFSVFEITPQYTIPASNIEISFLIEGLDIDGVDVDVLINGETINDSPLSWNSGALNDFDWYDLKSSFLPQTTPPFDLEAGETYSVRVEVETDDGGNVAFDRIAIFDDRFETDLTFDNSVNGSGQIDGPELYAPESITTNEIALSQLVTQARIDSSFNDTSNGQFVEIGNGQTQREDNSQTASVNFSNPEGEITVGFGLDGFGTNSNESPTQKRNAQHITDFEVFVNLDVLNISDVGRADIETIFRAVDVNNTTFAEAGQLNSSGTALTRSIFPDVTPTDQDLIFSEDVGFDI